MVGFCWSSLPVDVLLIHFSEQEGELSERAKMREKQREKFEQTRVLDFCSCYMPVLTDDDIGLGPYSESQTVSPYWWPNSDKKE